MNRSKQILTNNSLTDHDSILKVVTLPWHECHFQVLSECQFAILCCITFGKEITPLYPLTFLYSRFQVDTGFLVCLDELGKSVNSQVIFKAHQFLLFIAFVPDMNFVCIYKLDHAISFGMYLDPCITCCFAF